MIATLAGVLTVKDPSAIVVEVQGVGFEVAVPLSIYQTLPEPGAPVRLFTYLHVREDILKLYGFVTDEERQVFKLLIGVSGVGPSTAMSVLSGLTVKDLRRALAFEDAGALAAVPGIGKKTAQRLIMELKEKIGKVTAAATTSASGDSPADRDMGLLNDALAALAALGLKPLAARQAVDQVLKDAADPAKLTVQELIRKAIKVAQYGTTTAP
jgi:Holliday junction DNA helicase RuvA